MDSFPGRRQSFNHPISPPLPGMRRSFLQQCIHVVNLLRSRCDGNLRIFSAGGGLDWGDLSPFLTPEIPNCAGGSPKTNGRSVVFLFKHLEPRKVTAGSPIENGRCFSCSKFFFRVPWIRSWDEFSGANEERLNTFFKYFTCFDCKNIHIVDSTISVANPSLHHPSYCFHDDLGVLHHLPHLGSMKPFSSEPGSLKNNGWDVDPSQ